MRVAFLRASSSAALAHGKAAERLGAQAKPTFYDIDRVMAKTLSGVTSSLRFPGQLNSDLHKLARNLVPFYRLHFFTPSLAPLFPASGATSLVEHRGSEIVQQLFEAECTLAGCDPHGGRVLAAALFWRGIRSSVDVEEFTLIPRSRNASSFVEWIPNNVRISSLLTSWQLMRF